MNRNIRKSLQKGDNRRTINNMNDEYIYGKEEG